MSPVLLNLVTAYLAIMPGSRRQVDDPDKSLSTVTVGDSAIFRTLTGVR